VSHLTVETNVEQVSSRTGQLSEVNLDPLDVPWEESCKQNRFFQPYRGDLKSANGTGDSLGLTGNDDDKFDNLERLTTDEVVDVTRLLKSQKRQIEDDSKVTQKLWVSKY
jgi:hypothetical protein